VTFLSILETHSKTRFFWEAPFVLPEVWVIVIKERKVVKQFSPEIFFDALEISWFSVINTIFIDKFQEFLWSA